MKLNIKLLEKVKKAILKHPDNVDMNMWVSHGDDEAPCGTAGCIAGWTIAKASLKKLRKIRVSKNQSWGDRIQERAAKLLGINQDESENLFVPDFWPVGLWNRYIEASTRKRASKIVAKRIDEFIKKHKDDDET
jgi:hypothetical protein